MRERPSHPVKPAVRKTTLAVDVVVLSPQADTLAALLVRTAAGGRERWSLPWDATPGQHQISSRTTDRNGTVQTAVRTTPFPNGASGIQKIVVSVT